jgi:hypothetical protein
MFQGLLFSLLTWPYVASTDSERRDALLLAFDAELVNGDPSHGSH